MGIVGSKDPINDLYLGLLPKELKCLLISYITDSRLIQWFLSLDSLRDITYNCAHEIDHDPLNRTTFSHDIFNFKMLKICKVPIIVESFEDLIELSTHPSLKQFSIGIPAYLIKNNLQNTLDTVTEFFDNLITQRKSILDYEIYFSQDGMSRPDLYPILTILDPATSYLESLKIKVTYIVPGLIDMENRLSFVYKKGALEIEPIFSMLPNYVNLFQKFAESNNVTSLIFNKNLTEDQINQMVYLHLLPINKVYTYGIYGLAHLAAFVIFRQNINVKSFEYSTDIIKELDESSRQKAYRICSKHSVTFVQYLTSVFHAQRNSSVKFIYPISSVVINSFLQNIPNLSEVGMYDNIFMPEGRYQVITILLGQLNKIHIYGADQSNYEQLMAQYGDRIVFEN